MKFKTREEVCEALSAKKIKSAEALACLAEIEASEAISAKPFYCKVSEKGGLSVYGLQRMPVTLYRQQWERLLGKAQTVLDFIKANESSLKLKGAAAS